MANLQLGGEVPSLEAVREALRLRLSFLALKKGLDG